MTSEEQKQGGKNATIKKIIHEYHKIYNGAWKNLDFSKSSKRTFVNCGLILVLGAVASFTIVNKK